MSTSPLAPGPDPQANEAAAPTAVEAAAQRLLAAATSRTPCDPVRDLIGSDDVVAAYAVQELITASRIDAGSRVVGRKIGLTSQAVQKQLGVDQPDFGVLFDDMQYGVQELIPMSQLLQPKVEAEIAFVLHADLDQGAIDEAQVRNAVAYALAALEIVDSRVAGWDISFGDTVADNASSGLFVLGNEKVSLDAFEPVTAQMSMTMDGSVVSTGTGAACLGDPLAALRWLAMAARRLGQPLRRGQVVLSGALGPMVPVSPNTHVSADITGLGTVSARFGPADVNEGAQP